MRGGGNVGHKNDRLSPEKAGGDLLSGSTQPLKKDRFRSKALHTTVLHNDAIWVSVSFFIIITHNKNNQSEVITVLLICDKKMEATTIP